MRNLICDAQGFFKYENLLDGEYYVVTDIQWAANRYVLEGGYLMLRVSVKGAEIKEVVLAP
jgi:hypothetical protein